MEGENFYTVEQAAKVLKLTPGRIRQMLRAGELEGIPPEESGGRGWKSMLDGRARRMEQAT